MNTDKTTRYLICVHLWLIRSCLYGLPGYIGGWEWKLCLASSTITILLLAAGMFLTLHKNN
jgi:hypothetical protein